MTPGTCATRITPFLTTYIPRTAHGLVSLLCNFAAFLTLFETEGKGATCPVRKMAPKC